MKLQDSSLIKREGKQLFSLRYSEGVKREITKKKIVNGEERKHPYSYSKDMRC